MWDETDYTARWIQGISAVFLFPIGAMLEYYWWTTPYQSFTHRAVGAGGFGCLYLGYRCLRYALTGRNNINSDDLNSGNFE